MVRKNVQISNFLADRLESESKRLGVSQSNIMAIALDNYLRLNFDDEKKEKKHKNYK
ncbi:MAG: hypothetical protein E6330_08470 [Dialister sp.]|nr:hypothetical protein [Dialister sp.]MDU7143524.1 hypothetical protein [Anaerococcus vaginalis]